MLVTVLVLRVSEKFQVTAVVRPCTVPTGGAPLTVTSLPAGNVITNCKWLTANDTIEDRASVWAVVRVSSEVDARTTVEVGVHRPVLVQATEHSFMATCRPATPFVVSALATEAVVARVTAWASNVPVFVRSTYLLTVSPGANPVMAVEKPPVMPTTLDEAWVSLSVPAEMLPPEVLSAVAVRPAKTDEEIKPSAPSPAETITTAFVVPANIALVLYIFSSFVCT